MPPILLTGTLKFWVDGKVYGPGYARGVKGLIRWAVCAYSEDDGAQIVDTPGLERWKPWDGSLVAEYIASSSCSDDD
jgi:hypothetical protein